MGDGGWGIEGNASKFEGMIRKGSGIVRILRDGGRGRISGDQMEMATGNEGKVMHKGGEWDRGLNG